MATNTSAGAAPASIQDATSDFYERHALEYFDRTVAADMAHLYEPFLSRFNAGARLLDVGAGSGRDLREFVRRGFRARGIDASRALAGMATRYSGAPCDVGRLQDIAAEAEFDGIWACASLLHVPKLSLSASLRRLRCALVPGGGLFVSMQEGHGEQVAADGRFYALYRQDELADALKGAGFRVDRMWVTDDVLRDHTGPRWINVLATAEGRTHAPGEDDARAEHDAPRR